MARSSPKHQVCTGYEIEAGSVSPRSSLSSSVRAKNPSAPGSLDRFSRTSRLGRGPRGSSICRNCASSRPGRGVSDVREHAVGLALTAAAAWFLASSRFRRGSGLASAPQPMIATRRGAGVHPLDVVAGEPGPLGADLVELAAQGRAVAGVADQHGADLAGRIGHAQHGQAVVHRARSG